MTDIATPTDSIFCPSEDFHLWINLCKSNPYVVAQPF